VQVVVGSGLESLRVQALSSRLVRLEPIGPVGFEDRTTFTVVDRNFTGLTLTTVNSSSSEAWLRTDSYLLHVNTTAPPSATVLSPAGRCAATMRCMPDLYI
jgi:hypothetical protein